MVARTVTGDEMRRSRSGRGQQTTERDDCAELLVMKKKSSSKTNTTMTKKTKSESTTSYPSGLFHTVTASTPRAKRMARVYPHSSATGLVVRQAIPFRAKGVGGFAPLQQQQRSLHQQHAGDNGEGAGDEAMAWYTAAAGSLRDSIGSYQFDGSDCESNLCLTLMPTRIARQSSNGSSNYNAATYQRQSSDYSENGSTARRGSRATSAARDEPRATDHVQEDILSRIATLKALCDQGFITNDEYERRKSAIVDELTFSFSQRDDDDDDESDYGDENISDAEEGGAGTMLATMMTATQPNSRMLLGRSTEGLPLIVPHGPNFHDIKSETATKHVFDYVTRQWSSSQVQIALDETPFSKGSLRVVYHLLDLTRDEEDCDSEMSERRRAPKRKNYVAKLAIDPDEDPQTYFRDTELQAHCAHYAQMYNSYNPPKRVEFIEAWVLELTER